MKEKMKHDAKREVLEALRKMAMDHMAGGLKEGMKKVSVMAKDQAGLEKGLDKAKEIVGEMPMHSEPSEEDEESPEHEASESPEQEQEEHMSPEEIDAEIARLQELKARMRA